jgi:AcrR family transcriptional regulator
MPRSAVATRSKIVASAYRLMRRRGFSRVSVNDIATGAAVTKRTFYHHFDSKDALMTAVLREQHELSVAAFIGMIDRSSEPEHLVQALFDDLTTWSATKHWEGSGFTRLAVELADLPGHPARRMARQHKATLEHHLAERLESCRIPEAAAAAREILLLTEGAMVMILIHGDRSYASTAAKAARRLLRSGHNERDAA